jgi:NRPS condensation-like uncharacterized protein
MEREQENVAAASGARKDEQTLAPDVDQTTDDDSVTLQARVEVGDAAMDDAQAADDVPVADPVALLRHLDVSGRFHRDGRLGRVFHRGMVSLRENVAINSLHVVVDDNRVAAHVDRVSPLTVRSDGQSGYSVRQALVHNVAGMIGDLGWMLRGRQGDHRCELNCEWILSPSQSRPEEERLLDPRTSAWSVQMEARVAGALDEARLRSAIGTVLGRESVERDLLEAVDCDDDDALATARVRLQSMVVTVSASPPLRALLARHPAGDVLMLNVNHAAGDAFGALRVLRCIARAYADDADHDAPLDFLAVRDLPVRPASLGASIWARLYARTLERLRDMLDRPARVAADQPADEAGYGFHMVALSAEETRRVVDVAHSRTSTNVLMAALHLAIGEWNLQHGTPGRRVSALVQANLRPPEWSEDPIANFSVTARMSTRRRDRDGPTSALKAISTQAERNSRTRTGIALIGALERNGLLSLWAKQSIVVLHPLTGNRLVDSTLLCNLGWLDEAPSFGPDAGETVELWFSTPARAPLSLCLGAATVGGRLHLTLRYPHRLFSADAARRFAECYLERLRLVAASRS